MKKILLIPIFICLLVVGLFVFAQHSHVIYGDSMEPSIHDGDIVLIKSINFLGIKEFNPNELAVGDIVSYNSKLQDYVIIGRIINVSDNEGSKYYTVKGDNDDTEGESVYPDQIISKVMKIGDKPIIFLKF
ncbi:MAG: signal peptidase I [Methanobrevibacter sp.]|nr:signal peptidase I [Methanobrevibacter sp.]